MSSLFGYCLLLVVVGFNMMDSWLCSEYQRQSIGFVPATLCNYWVHYLMIMVLFWLSAYIMAMSDIKLGLFNFYGICFD